VVCLFSATWELLSERILRRCHCSNPVHLLHVAIVLMSGWLTVSQRFLQKIKNVDVTVYDSNAGVGGTWYANNYPVSRLAQKVPIEHVHHYS